jgi:predicted RNase H-like nuclease
LGGHWLAGVDGCRLGWLAVSGTCSGDRVAQTRLTICRTFAEILALPERPAWIAVDMPIGLPDAAQPGGRTCDQAARALLGPRSSSIFSPPARAVLGAGTYAEALIRSRGSGPSGTGLSRQAFNLLPKVRELDTVMDPQLQGRVLEAHPELAFRTLAGHPARHGKRTPEGRAERRALLAPHFLGRLPVLHASAGAAVDDLLDACALILVAHRIDQGRGQRLPGGNPPLDAHGLRMEIWF